MKTTKDIDNWIRSEVEKEYIQIPPFVIDSARRTNTIDLIYNHISTRTGINTDTIKEVLSDQPLHAYQTSNPTEDIFSGKYEVEITDELIQQVQREQNMTPEDVQWLRDAREMGGKWNTKRKSIMFPPEWTFDD